MEATTSEIKKTVPYFLDKVDDTIEETVALRELLIDSIKESVLKMELDPKTDAARATEVKLASISTLNSLLNDKEKTRFNRAKLALQDKTNSIMEDVGRDITTILPHIGMEALLNGKYTRPSDTETDEKIERIFADTGMEITPEELESDPTIV